jgi:hypothetical protein
VSAGRVVNTLDTGTAGRVVNTLDTGTAGRVVNTIDTRTVGTGVNSSYFHVGGVQLESRQKHGLHWLIYTDFLIYSMQMSAYYLIEGTTVSFHILSNSLFTAFPTIDAAYAARLQ